MGHKFRSKNILVMTIANTFAAKASVAFVALAMALMMVAPAQAATASELQAQIDALMAQIAGLTSTTPAASTAAYVFTRPLTIGAQGADVTALQNYLIAGGYAIPAGATGYFGAQTAAAVAAWQTANGVMPAAGYFGPVSQAKYAALMAAAPADDSSDDSASDDSSDDTSSSDLSGEADLKSFSIEDGDDADIEEGQVSESVQEFQIEFQDGDASISRLDVNFDTDSTIDDLWDVLGDVTLYVDGKEVKTIDGSDEDNYQSDDETLRFTGLDIVAMEDDEITVTLGVEVQDNLDDNDQTVTVDVTGMRFVDGDDVTTTLDASEVDADTNTFDISAAGSEDELIIKTSTEDPSAATLVIDDQTTKSDWYTVFAFDLDTDDSINDIDLNNVGVNLVTGTDNVNDVVQDAELIIDGESYDDWSWASVDGTTMGLDFNVDGDHTISAGDRVTAELKLRFYGVGSGVNEGETIQASASTTLMDAEGVENVTATGGATGDEHTLRSSGLTVDAASVETDTTTQGQDDTTGIFTIDFDVTALQGDFYVNDYATKTASAVLAGVDFNIEGPGTPVTSAVLSSTADDDSGAFLVREGETETFTLTVTVTASVAGQHRITLNQLRFSTNSNGITSAQIQDLAPASDYRTDYQNINI